MFTDFRLKVFVAVSQSLSFTRAAVELNISQPAITKHIKELEKLVGEALFIRQGNKISPTPKALSLLPFARAVLAQYETLNENISPIDSSFEGYLHIGASTTVAQYLLPQVLAKFSLKYPKIKIDLTSGNSSKITSELINQNVEFAIVEGSEKNHAIHYENLALDEIILVTSHPSSPQISIEQIKNLPLVVRENGSGTLDVVEQALKEVKIARKELNIVIQLGSSEAIIRYLLNSPTFAFISIGAVKSYLESGQLHQINISNLLIKRQYRFASLHGKSGKIIELFKRFCLGQF